MPTFGRDTICRFVNNVTEMKQLAARNFEDLLQVHFFIPYQLLAKAFIGDISLVRYPCV